MAEALPHGHVDAQTDLATAQLMPAVAQTSHAGTGGPQFSAVAALDSGPHMPWSVSISTLEKSTLVPVTRGKKLSCSAAHMLAP